MIGEHMPVIATSQAPETHPETSISSQPATIDLCITRWDNEAASA